MKRRDRERLVMMNRVKSKEIGRREAAGLLGLSLRQMHRVYLRYLAEGDAGVIHRGRGRVSNRRIGPVQRDQALALYREHYAARDGYEGFGPTLFAEKLGKEHGLYISHDTARRWMIGWGLLAKELRRSRRSRRRRLRKARFGQMVQMDGSDHDWFEGRGGRGKRCTLMVMVDDATGKKMGRFYAEETLEAALSMMTLWCKAHGVPESLYVDRAGIYRCDRDQTLEEVRTGKQPTTQFGRAMKELGVRLILARSPQAKGRVERANGTLQDRLTKELRLKKISSIESANAFLERSGFFEDLNQRQAVAPVDDTDAHRALVVELKDVLCIKDKRSVGHDGCVQWCGKILQLAAIKGKSWPRVVEVSSSAAGVLQSIRSGALNWQWRELEKLPAKPAKKKITSERGVPRKPTALMRRQHNSLFNPTEPWPSGGLRKAS